MTKVKTALSGKIVLVSLFAAVALAACGGGGGGAPASAPTSVETPSAPTPSPAPSPAPAPAPAPAPVTLHYTDKVFAVWTGGYLYSVTKTGVTKVTNLTKYTSGAIPLGDCGLKPKTEADGTIGAACKDSTGIYRKLLLDPVASTLSNGGDEMPIDSEYVFLEVDPANGGDTAKVSDGTYFITGGARWEIYFQSNSGTITPVKVGSFADDGSIKAMLSYSN